MSWKAFFKGMGRVLDLFGTMRPRYKRRRRVNGFEEDRKKLNEDWKKVLGIK